MKISFSSARDRVTREDTGVDTASMSVTLFKLAEEDFGEYSCHCNNSLGATRTFFMLYGECFIDM